MTLLEGPRVDGAAVANEPEQPWLLEFRGGPLIQALQARHEEWVASQHAAPVELARYPMPPADLPLIGLLRDLL